MKNKLAFVSGMAVGYVLWSRAGRNSYEKLKVKVRGFRQGPTRRDQVTDTAEASRNKAPEVQEQASQAAREEITGAPRRDTTPHHDGAASGTLRHNPAKADSSESDFYGIGGPASHESLAAETAQRAHHQDTGSQDRTN